MPFFINIHVARGIVDEEKRESVFDTTTSLFADFAKDSILFSV